jgi:hypothetical protein
MRDHTRRRICRAGFFGLCLLPTVITPLWAAVWRSAWHHAQCEQALAEPLGLAVSAERVRPLRPGFVAYEGLSLSDPESAATWIRAARLELGRYPQGLVLRAQAVEMDGQAASEGNNPWRELFATLQARLRRAGATEQPVMLAADRVVVRVEGATHVLVDVRGRFESVAGSSGAAMTFRLAGQRGDGPISAEPVRLRLLRHRQADQPAWRVEIDTQGAALPASLALAPWSAGLVLGEEAGLRGVLWAERSGSRWQGQCQGELLGVDLQRLVGERFPHQFSGLGQIGVERAWFRDGRLEGAEGTLHAGPGLIGESLLSAAADSLHLIRGTAPVHPGSAWEYDQLALRFAIDSSGLALRGLCREAPAGTLVAQRDVPLLLAHGGPCGPVVALLRALTPDSAVQVPATRQSERLMQLLPVPPVIPSVAAPATTPAGSTRVGARPPSP